MSSTLRSLTRQTRTLSHRFSPTASLPTRSIHSVFTALSSPASPLTTPQKETKQSPYEKQADNSPDPLTTYSGNQTYVVSEPDPANTPYAVPFAAYSTSAPYQNFTSTEPPENAHMSSTSSQPAHPVTTNAVPHNESGVGASAAVRYKEAPGPIGKKGSGYSGLKMMDQSETVRRRDAEPGERNPPPNVGKVAEKFSKAGVDEAWKLRK